MRFTPLYGVHGGQPLCYLLELGGFVILLDCGWDDSYDPALLRPLHDVLEHIDLGAAGECVWVRAGEGACGTPGTLGTLPACLLQQRS